VFYSGDNGYWQKLAKIAYDYAVYNRLDVVLHWGVAGGSVATEMYRLGFMHHYGYDISTFNNPYIISVDLDKARLLCAQPNVLVIFDAYVGVRDKYPEICSSLPVRPLHEIRNVLNIKGGNTFEVRSRGIKQLIYNA